MSIVLLLGLALDIGGLDRGELLALALSGGDFISRLGVVLLLGGRLRLGLAAVLDALSGGDFISRFGVVLLLGGRLRF